MYEIYRFCGIAVSLLWYLYLCIWGLLVFFKYESILKKISPKLYDVNEGILLFGLMYTIFCIFAILSDFVNSTCVAAIINSVIIGTYSITTILYFIGIKLGQLRDKLPER